jgi:hypothetical protein
MLLLLVVVLVDGVVVVVVDATVDAWHRLVTAQRQ